MKKALYLLSFVCILIFSSCLSLFEEDYEPNLPNSISKSDKYITYDPSMVNITELIADYSPDDYVHFYGDFYIWARANSNSTPALLEFNLKTMKYDYSYNYYVDDNIDYDLWFGVENGKIEINHYHSDFSSRQRYIYDTPSNDSHIIIGNDSVSYDVNELFPKEVVVELSQYGGTNYHLYIPADYVDEVLKIADGEGSYIQFGMDKIPIDRNVRYLIAQYGSLLKNYDKAYEDYISGFRAKIEKAIPDLTDYEFKMIFERKIYKGMREAVLYASWGYPDYTNRSVGSWGTSNQLVYRTGAYSNYVYVENGRVTSWQT